MTTTNVSTRTYQYTHTIGIDEFMGRGFRLIVDLVPGPNGMLYVLQRGEPLHRNPAIKICDINEGYYGDFGAYGSERGQMVWPAAIAIDSQQRLYVSDEWNHRITVFDTKGNVLDEWGTLGSGDGQLNRPSGLAFDAEENLLVVDALNHRVQRFTKAGRFLAKWGTYGVGPGQLNMPWGVAVNAAGEVYVTDWRNDRVQKFTARGEFLLQWGYSGEGDGEFNRPAGIDVDREGDVYVVDWHNNRIQIFDAVGRSITKLAGDATLSSWGKELLEVHPEMQEQRRVAKDLSQEKRFRLPRGVKVDHQNRVIVVDSTRGRLQIYQKVT